MSYFPANRIAVMIAIISAPADIKNANPTSHPPRLRDFSIHSCICIADAA